MTEETRSVEHTASRRIYKWELLGLLCLAFFFHQGDRAIYSVVATEIQADLQLSKAEIGLVGAILFWTIALMTPRNVLVTGSARNTGLGIAKVFGSYGGTVFVHGRSAEKVETVVQSLNHDASTDGEKYVPIAADVACEEDVVNTFAFIEQQVGGLDVLVNNACHLGLGHRFLDMPIAFFDEVLAVNPRGYALCAQHAAKQMIAGGGGAIVNIGSNTSERALSDRAAYIASKGGVESLTRAIAVELAEHQIRVNCVVPGYIYTERWDTLPEEIKERRWKNVPLGKAVSQSERVLDKKMQDKNMVVTT